MKSDAALTSRSASTNPVMSKCRNWRRCLVMVLNGSCFSGACLLGCSHLAYHMLVSVCCLSTHPSVCQYTWLLSLASSHTANPLSLSLRLAPRRLQRMASLQVSFFPCVGLIQVSHSTRSHLLVTSSLVAGCGTHSLVFSLTATWVTSQASHSSSFGYYGLSFSVLLFPQFGACVCFSFTRLSHSIFIGFFNNNLAVLCALNWLGQLQSLCTFFSL